jgi:squalene-hopene/tetraprenyl-beta-curcumene cyclase
MSIEWVSPDERTHRSPLHQVAEQRQAQMRRLAQAVERCASALWSQRHPDGYWCGELTADSTLESDYVLLQLWLHPASADTPSWQPPSREAIDKACRFILARQLADGGWNIFPGGAAEVNATVRAYTVLKIAGHGPESDYMVRARNRILSLGGLQACNSYTKINFSLFGLYPRKYVPSVPPELVLVPGDLLYEMSSWTRAIIVPLSIVQSIGITRPTPGNLKVEELFVPGKRLSLPKRDAAGLVFTQVDRAVKVWEKLGWRNIRSRGIREAERWMLERTRYADGLGAIYPSMMYLIMALDSLNYTRDQPDLVDAIAKFENLVLEAPGRFQFQPCFSPVWDTAICMFAMGESGAPALPTAPPEGLTQAADWLLSKEVRRKGDWSIKRPDLEPGGWAFEFANESYPDIDDTAMVLLALQHAHAGSQERQEKAQRRAIGWLLGMQSEDGGWAAFDVDNNWRLLNKIPFADHNAMLDPTCPDITGRVLEALIRSGLGPTHEAIVRGVRFLLQSQERDGSWFGRWGVNYVYGTFLALRGLRATGLPADHSAVERGAEFLISVQNRDGGWGESCLGYDQKRFVPAASTASQTAWALLGLAAAGKRDLAVAQRGLEYLLEIQRPDGTWPEALATGTGFPGVFYLTYHMYRNYFPLLALATFGR